MRRIAMVLGGKFPPDIRVEKEAMVLIDAGFEIYIFAFGKRIVDEYNKIKIYSCERTPFFPKRAVENMRFFAFHYHPKFATFIRAGIEKLKPDAIHIHDIPFFKTAYLAGKLLNTKFVLDLHENYPAALLEYRKGKRGIEWFKYFLGGNYKAWKRYERWCIKRSDGIIVVADESHKRVVDQYRIDPNKIIVVSNTLEKSIFELPFDERYSSEIRNKGKILLLYLGGFGAHRGIDTAIKAVWYIKDRCPSLKLLLIGGVKEYIERINGLIKSLNVSEFVEVIPWQDYRMVRTIIESVDICLVPHNRSEHTDTTIPHKLFQYMAFGKPVVVSDAPPLKKIVEKERCGLVFEGGNYIDLGEKILEIIPKMREFGENGRKAVLENYIFEKTDGKRLVEFYRELLK